MQQFIFKTVPAGHKARLQSAEHKRAKKGGGSGTWCTQRETASHHRWNIKLNLRNHLQNKTMQGLYFGRNNKNLRGHTHGTGDPMQNYCNYEFTGDGPSTMSTLSNTF